jgi:hypothetical protein
MRAPRLPVFGRARPFAVAAVINALDWQTFVFYAFKSAPRYRVFVKSPILPKYRARI